MKIAVPSDDQQTIAQHFGRAAGFMIFDQEAAGEYRLNGFSHHGRTGGGALPQVGAHSHAGILSGLDDCQIVIAGGMGQRLYQDLTHAGFTVLLTDHKLIADAVAAFRAGELSDQPERRCAGHHHPG